MKCSLTVSDSLRRTVSDMYLHPGKVYLGCKWSSNWQNPPFSMTNWGWSYRTKNLLKINCLVAFDLSFVEFECGFQCMLLQLLLCLVEVMVHFSVLCLQRLYRIVVVESGYTGATSWDCIPYILLFYCWDFSVYYCQIVHILLTAHTGNQFFIVLNSSWQCQLCLRRSKNVISQIENNLFICVKLHGIRWVQSPVHLLVSVLEQL